MRKHTKRLLAFLLTLVMVVSLVNVKQFSVTAEAPEAKTEVSRTETFTKTDTAAKSGDVKKEESKKDSSADEDEKQDKQENGESDTAALKDKADADDTDDVSGQKDQTAVQKENAENDAGTTDKQDANSKGDKGSSEKEEEDSSDNSDKATSEEIVSEEKKTSAQKGDDKASVSEDNKKEETDETDKKAETSSSEDKKKAEESQTDKDGTTAEMKEYAPESQPEGVTIKAYAPADAFPEGTTLHTVKLADDALKEAAVTLEGSGVTYDGFLGYDISFHNADGEEIELEDGSVKIELSLDASILPEEINEETVAVQHLKENANGIDVETVAKATEDSLDVTEEKVDAAFSVDSFSQFTITWQSTQQSIKVQYVDISGNSIQGTQVSNITVNKDKTVTLADYAGAIDGYEYQYARIENVKGSEVTQIKCNSWSIGHYYTEYYLQYTSNGWNWNDLSNDTTIYLVYKADAATPGGGGTPGGSGDINHTKFVEENVDGTYDLSLTVSGKRGSKTNKALVDVIFVLDKSGSMDYSMSSNDDRYADGGRRESASTAINTMVNSLAGNDTLDTRFALVTFSGDQGDWVWDGIFSGHYEDRAFNDAQLTVEWTGSASAITRASSPDSDGGTNYQSGIREAKNLLQSARNGATTVVVFVSDGDPTYYYDEEGDTVGNGSGYDSDAMDAAEGEVANIGSDYFYTVGVGPSDNYQKLRDLKDESDATTKDFYAGTDTESLQNAFEEIQGEIETLACTNVVITDTLSDNVEIVSEGGDLKALEVRVVKNYGTDDERDISVTKNDDGTVSFYDEDSEKTVALTPAYDKDTKKITLTFPTAYELNPDYTYIVTANIDATEAAYKLYRSDTYNDKEKKPNSYPNTGEAGTGTTSDGKKGVFTNKEATVSYKYNDQTKVEEYAMPVIQLHPGKLVIEKTIEGLDNLSSAELEEYKERLTFNYIVMKDKASIASGNVALDEFTYDEETKTYTYTAAEGMSPDSSYKVTESGGAVEGYQWTQDSEQAQGTIAKDSTKTALFTNTYAKNNVSLTVFKKVEGNMGSTDENFTFSLALKNGDAAYTETLSATKTTSAGTSETTTLPVSDGKYTFTLKNGESINISIPYGYTYEVSEDAKAADDGYTTEIAVNGDGAEIEDADTPTAGGDLKEATTVTFTNTKNVHAPTGLSGGSNSWMILLGAAAVFAVTSGLYGLRRKKTGAHD